MSSRIKKINLIDESDMPYKTALGHTYDSGNFKKNLSELCKISDYKSFSKKEKVYPLKIINTEVLEFQLI